MVLFLFNPTTTLEVQLTFCAFKMWNIELTRDFQFQCEKMSLKLQATARKRLSNDDKLAIIEASKSPGFSKEEAMKKWGIRRTQMYDLLKN